MPPGGGVERERQHEGQQTHRRADHRAGAVDLARPLQSRSSEAIAGFEHEAEQNNGSGEHAPDRKGVEQHAGSLLCDWET